jgi:hypothetical protein
MRALLNQAMNEAGPDATPEAVGARWKQLVDETGDPDLIAEFKWTEFDLDQLQTEQ